MEAKRASNGYAYLNVGCGSHFFPEWNNLDLHGPPGVVSHDVRQPLPFAEGTFDAVYSSHVLEHLKPADGENFLREQARVLKPGGICRIAVPDLEKNCRDYLAQLEKADSDPTPSNLLDYQWSVFQLIDQMVREECGGEMLHALREGRFNPEFLRSRYGDEFSKFAPPLPEGNEAAATEPPGALDALKGRLKTVLGRDARGRGEAHRWMYDRLSLRLLTTKVGLGHFRTVTYLESSIPDWKTFNLDLSQDGSGPRKPDSLFVEARLPNKTA